MIKKVVFALFSFSGSVTMEAHISGCPKYMFLNNQPYMTRSTLFT